MVRYYYFSDADGNERRVLTFFDRWDWERDQQYNPQKMTDAWGFDLEWHTLTLVNGLNGDLLPRMKHIPLGTLIAGKRKTHEEEIAKARRFVTQLGETYEIREYMRIAAYTRAYKWFGWTAETSHVYKVIGKDCPRFSFANESWGHQKPSDFEIINQAKETKRLVESI